ncbi:MAG: hypothetical protein AAFO94_07205 [Bacteroidota bacterium]
MKQEHTTDEQIASAKAELKNLCTLLSEDTRNWLQKFNEPREEKLSTSTDSPQQHPTDLDHED